MTWACHAHRGAAVLQPVRERSRRRSDDHKAAEEGAGGSGASTEHAQVRRRSDGLSFVRMETYVVVVMII